MLLCSVSTKGRQIVWGRGDYPPFPIIFGRLVNPIQIRRGRFERRFSLTLYVKVQKYEKVSNFLICGANDVVKHYEIFIKILYGCPFEGRY